MKLTILQPVLHDGQCYAPGDSADLPKATAATLIACGAAEKPQDVATESETPAVDSKG
jgi:hypothetical protein